MYRIILSFTFCTVIFSEHFSGFMYLLRVCVKMFSPMISWTFPYETGNVKGIVMHNDIRFQPIHVCMYDHRMNIIG